MSQRSIEVKVGALIIVSLGLLAAFVVVMGGLSLEPTFRVMVDFENPGGLQSGAPVRIAGVKVGRVTAIEFRGGQLDPRTKEPEAPIRVIASIESQYQKAIYDNSRWFVTSQGVLGEMFLAIEPGSHDRPLLKDGAVVHGISPPRLDLLLSEGYELLHHAYVGISKNEDKIAELFDGLHKTLKGTGAFLERNDKRLDSIVVHVDKLGEETREALHKARERYVDGPQVTRIVNNLERVTNTLNRDLGPLLEDSRTVASDMKKVSGKLATEEQLARYDKLLREMTEAVTLAKLAASDAQKLTAHVSRGEGTVGALVMDEALYDDLQEMLRDLKNNPWKFFWRQ